MHISVMVRARSPLYLSYFFVRPHSFQLNRNELLSNENPSVHLILKLLRSAFPTVKVLEMDFPEVKFSFLGLRRG